MRKLILLMPLLFVPGFAGAGHASPLEKATARLEVRADEFYREVAHLRGNWYLKREAWQFARQSRRLARQVAYGERPRRLGRSIARLEAGFFDLRLALDYARIRHGKKYLRKDLRRLGKSLARVVRRFGPGVRLASGRGGVARRDLDYLDNDFPRERSRRYRR